MKLGPSLITEFIGLLAFCFVGGGAICITAVHDAGAVGLLGVAAAHGLILSVCVSAGMHISGAHFNPAVTIGLLVTGRIKVGPALMYIIAQLAGGTAAGFILAYVFTPDATGGVDVISAVKLGTPTMAAGIGMGKAIVIEVIISFFLMFVVYGTAVDPRARNVGGFGIGLTVAANILVAGPLTGASMNPARTFGTGFPAFFNGFKEFWAEQPIYWIGPIIGAVLAALVYHHFLIGRNTSK